MDIDKNRVGWVDYAKGFCIIMVVMMHSTLGVEKAAGGSASFMSWVVEFARPFRMPDFFMISGLFLGRVIDRPWRVYLDKKVVHFGYFYALWVTIQFAFKAPQMAAQEGWAGVAEDYLVSYVQPFGSMWFIYLLPVFFVFTKLCRNVWPPLMFAVLAGLQIANVQTGSMVIDEFCARFVFFYTGYWLSPYIFRFADNVIANQRQAAFFLCAWALFEAITVFLGYSTLPFVSLGLGLIGAIAVISFSSLLSTRNEARVLRYAGQNSIVVYLAFFLPMATTRVLLLKFAPWLNLGITSLIVTAIGVIVPLILFEATKNTRFRFLFHRPSWARLEPRPQATPGDEGEPKLASAA